MSSQLRAIAVAATLLLVVAACDSSAPSSSATASPPASTAASAASATARPVASPVATLAWLAPAPGKPVTASVATFTVTTIATDVRRFEFDLRYGSHHVAACVAAQPTADGDWSCKADLLKLGIPPGRVSVTATAVDTAEHKLPNLSGSRFIAYEVAPPKPTATTFKVMSQKVQADRSTVEVDRITWKAPAGYATEFRLYGVTSCPNDAPGHDGQPCLVEHMPLAASDLHLIRKVDGSARSMLIRNTLVDGECGPTLWCSNDYAIVLAALNAYGHSVYAIPLSATVCHDCVY